MDVIFAIPNIFLFFLFGMTAWSIICLPKGVGARGCLILEKLDNLRVLFVEYVSLM